MTSKEEQRLFQEGWKLGLRANKLRDYMNERMAPTPEPEVAPEPEPAPEP